MFEIRKDTLLLELQKHRSKCMNVIVKMEKPHAHDENEQPCTMQKGYAMLRSK